MEIIEEQKQLCEKYGSEYYESAPFSLWPVFTAPAVLFVEDEFTLK